MTARNATTQAAATVLIVDDHPLVRAGLSKLIEGESDLTVCGEAANVRTAMQLVESLKPDLAIIDLSLQDGHGLDLIQRIHEKDPSIRMLVSSMHDESLYAERSVRAGACGYINKQEAADEVLTAVRLILKGKLYLSARMAVRLIEREADPTEIADTSPLECLSNRELEVFELIGTGLATGEIAKRLHRSTKTIESHREHIKRKLGLRSGPELTRRAIQWALDQ